jgi:endonuclease/exonuclease/phosphatase family metal-dependent hydrolase
MSELQRWDRASRVSSEDTTSRSGGCRVVTWNIERGYNHVGQAEWLRRKGVDIALLQEVDIGCKRTGSCDVFRAVGESAGFNHGVFVTEFVEIDSPHRSARLAGGGVHGNAILSRHPIRQAGVVRLSQFYDWTKCTSQPRQGERVAVWADIELPQRGGEVMRFYSVHNENFCGALERLQQLCEIQQHRTVTWGNDKPCCIGGDLNTLMHGAIRLLPGLYPARDNLFRFWSSLGSSEAEWLQQHVLTDAGIAAVTAVQHQLPVEAMRALSTLEDPLPKGRAGNTLCSSILTCISCCYTAKLDWLLVSRDLHCTNSGIGGSGLSDHHCVWVDLALSKE